jgi:regulator of sigma E protease
VDLLYFVVLISVLIFTHESGHFAFAKIFGVKVITFSIGFGPRIVRIRGKETEYCIALFPLGGFVKMLEESKATEEILPEERHRTFEAQALWKRILIVLAGPAMNILFPVALYASVFLEDRTFLPPTVGIVVPGRPADGKLIAGDRIVAVEGALVSSYPEVQHLIARNAGVPLRFTVERDGRRLDVTITPEDETETRELDIVDHVARIGFAPSFPAPVIGVPRTDSPAYRAGLRTFDRIVAVNGRKVDRLIDLFATLAANRGDQLLLTYLRPIPTPRALGGLCDIAVFEPGLVTVTPMPKPPGSTSGAEDEATRAADVLLRAGVESADMYASFVPEGSSEWQAGLRAGDRITSLDGVSQRLWLSMKDALRDGASRMHTLTWTRDGERGAGSFQVRRERWEDEFGQPYERYVFRTTHWAPNAVDEVVPNPNLVLHAARRGIEETVNVIRFIATGLLRIAQGRVSLKSVSGPITIYDIAGQAGAKGTTDFVWAMAVISVNLGLINLLPIPVLDGGHLLFFAVEGIARRPVSLRAREIASLVGMILLLALMLLAFKNDVTRHWDVIVRQFREVVGG